MAARLVEIGKGWICTMYSYENVDLGIKHMMYVLSEDDSGNGWIGFQLEGETLPWQGDFRFKNDQTIELCFDCKGEGNLKSCKLWRTADGGWSGYDYACRHVYLTEFEKMKYCTVCKLWHRTGFNGFCGVRWSLIACSALLQLAIARYRPHFMAMYRRLAAPTVGVVALATRAN